MLLRIEELQETDILVASSSPLLPYENDIRFTIGGRNKKPLASSYVSFSQCGTSSLPKHDSYSQPDSDNAQELGLLSSHRPSTTRRNINFLQLLFQQVSMGYSGLSSKRNLKKQFILQKFNYLCPFS